MLMATLGGQYLLSEHGRVSQHRATQVQALLDSATQFQVFATAFSTEMFAENSVSTATRSRLLENLNDQIAKLRMIEPVAPLSAKQELEDYRVKVVEMTKVIARTNDILSMRDFWSRASDLTVARNTLNRKLQASI